MMLQQINEAFFLLINASPFSPTLLVNFAIFCAKHLIYFIALIGIWFSFFRTNSHLLIGKIIVTVTLALAVCYLIRTLAYFPRPFSLGIGTNFLEHNASSSLPSQHATAIWAIAMTFWFNQRSLFLPVLIIAVLISWSRIYLGIHWPLDIVLALVISSTAAWLVSRYWPVIKKIITPFFQRYWLRITR